jgi:hypothetical protein
VKVLNAVNLLPIAAFFLPLPLQCIAGIIPTYWPMHAPWSAVDSEPISFTSQSASAYARVAGGPPAESNRAQP